MEASALIVTTESKLATYSARAGNTGIRKLRNKEITKQERIFGIEIEGIVDSRLRGNDKLSFSTVSIISQKS